MSDPVCSVLVVDDDASIRDAVAKTLVKEGYAVDEAQDGVLALDVLRRKQYDLVLADLRMPKLDGMGLLRAVKASNPDIPFILITGHGTIDDAVESLKLGAFDFVQKPFKRQDLLRTVEKALSTRRLIQENTRLKERLAAEEDTRRIIGASPSIMCVLDLVNQVAPSTATVLLRGESGTGKELAAEELHRRSRRADSPFVRVSCAALPETLLEAELFGHEKGAFTGAVAQRKGRFEVAHGGTLFLDEVGELSAPTQVKLLRVLQEGEFQRLGSSDTIKVDVRVVAATNADIRRLVRLGTFREDLYYRLNVVEIVLPSLRERSGDIPLLADHFRRKYALRNEKVVTGFHGNALAALEAYDWPGNVRELENAVERAVVLCTTTQIGVNDLPREVWAVEQEQGEVRIPLGTSMADAKRRILIAALRAANGDKQRAAAMLGIATRTIYRMLSDEQLDSAVNANNPAPLL
jgi:two-component system response regulator HydG